MYRPRLKIDSLRCSLNSISFKRLLSASSTKPKPSNSGVRESVSNEKKNRIGINKRRYVGVFRESLFVGEHDTDECSLEKQYYKGENAAGK